ncbi:hypothetical protein [Salipiger mucosus]|uniref:Outer membrane lipoprotein BfpB n=1 Tax=Salipiger mucosus DSM 16094 TaxID=1123237 RepID=S9QQ44_9RHOB|nr:hypothetical protein [Salipiger mucosus]EPX83526.1 Outer membrane lipoprotein BfpB [Salipiger mucosus DSM 16094]
MTKAQILKSISALTFLAVAACSTPAVQEADKVTDNARQETERLMVSSAQPLPQGNTANVQVSDKIWLGSQARELRNGKPLPRAVEREGVTLVSFQDLDIMGIAALLDETTGIPVSVEESIVSNSGSGYPREMSVDYEGKLSKFLGRVGNHFGINWRYDGDEIDFFLHRTRTYAVRLLPSSSTGNMSVSSGGGGSGGGGGEGSSGSSSQSMNSTFSINIWEELVTAIQGIVQPRGTVTASRSTGTLSITAPNAVHDKVADYIAQQNKRLSKQVAVSVQVFNVSMDDSGELATDFSLADVESGEFDFRSSGGSNDLASSLGWQILEPIGRIGNLSGAVRMLEEKGDVSVVTTANATTLNNVPTPIQVGNERSYVSEISEETDQETNETSTTFETSSVQTGFNMQVLPRVVSNGQIALQYNISTSELVGSEDGFERFAVGGSEVQLPNINNRSFTQQVMVPQGNTLVLSGFEQTTSRSDRQGVGSAENWLTGGRVSGSLERDVMVIMITPVILDTGKAIEEIR